MANVLVVDDHADNRALLTTLLSYAGHRSFESVDGSEALVQVRSQRPDLVICDIVMPTMDGYEFVRQLREDPEIASTEVIFYTATFLEREARGLAESCGVKYVLTKPCGPEEILRTVERALHHTTEPIAVPDPKLFDREHHRLMTDKLVEKATELQIANQRLSALTDLNLQLASERDPHTLLDKFCRGTRDLFGARCAILAVRNKNRGESARCASWGIAAADVDRMRAVPIDLGIFGSVMADRKPYRFTASSGNAFPPGLSAAYPSMQSGLIVPIVSLHHVYGWIFLLDKVGLENFTDDDEYLLSIHAAQAGRIYENGSLYANVQRHAARLEQEVATREKAQRQLDVQFAVARVLAEACTWDEAIASFFRVVCQNLYFALGSLFRIDSASDAAYCVAGWCSDLPLLGDFMTRTRESKFKSGIDAIGRVWLTGRSYLTSNIAEEADFTRASSARMAGLCAAIFVPVVSHGNKIGVLEFFDRESREIDSDLQQTLEALGGQVGQFMERQRQQLNIERLNRIYAVLSGVSSLIVRVRDRTELFRGACRIAVEQGRFRKVWIGVLDSADGRIVLTESGGGDAVYFDKLRDLLLTAPETAYAPFTQKLREGQALIFNDVEHDTTMFLRNDLLESGSRALVWLPMIVAGHPAGVLVLHAAEKGFFDADEMRLLLELAGDIAFALEHIAKTDRLDYLAHFDALTGLANPMLFHQRLEKRLVRTARDCGILAVVLVDISRLKTINKAFGRKIGDGLLKQVADCLARCVADPTDVARLGGDNFALIVENMHSQEELTQFVDERVLARFRAPFQVGGVELRSAGTVGIALFPRDGENVKTLIENAESALGEAKISGDRYLFYTKQMSDRVTETLALESSLRTALERNEFVLHYQPKVDICNRQLEGVEALIRWNSPQFGLVPPLKFIPLLEETGLIVEVGSWVWRRASRDYADWLAQGVFAPRIAVNMSVVQLRRHDFVSTIAALQKSTEESVEIDIEITESTAMDEVADSIEKLHELYALGINIAIDDFGTGYSSLAYLAKLPAHVLKIDRSFISTMLEDPDKMSLVSTMISLAHSMHMKVVAEGVETQDQANMLRLLRCDQMQGYLVAKPMPFEQMTAYIRNRELNLDP
ncbi:EAL domain-containing protein [Dokdonella soli]|uniref:EAL domain-containing protein n=1 Tax=Dokdonella soli TaxID=529810 RepID=A0ABP3TTZ1_9GAMM